MGDTTAAAHGDHRGADDWREELRRAALELEQRGLNHNAAGNLSRRVGELIGVTPSGIPAHRLVAADMVLLDADGTVRADQRRVPTSEWRLHTAVYAARADIGAIVHTHSPEATAAACLGLPVPAVHYVIARFGGDQLVCAPYATYGSEELASAVRDTLGADRHACLMTNHGAIVGTADLDGAVSMAADVEWLCGVYRRSIQFGSPRVLDRDEIDRVATRFRTYGQASDASDT